MASDFVDLATRARELGITDGLLRARILSEKLDCFVYIARLDAYGNEESFLPPYDRALFEHVAWRDYGSSIDYEVMGHGHSDILKRRPRYRIDGWVIMYEGEVDRVLTIGEAELHGSTIYVVTNDRSDGYGLLVDAPCKKEWVTIVGSEDGGFYREVPQMIRREDLFMRSESNSENKRFSPREEASLFRIVAAMLALLQANDGGGFPSQAKVIDLLTDRFGAAEGISKRNLEKVFAEAARVAGQDLKHQA